MGFHLVCSIFSHFALRQWPGMRGQMQSPVRHKPTACFMMTGSLLEILGRILHVIKLIQGMSSLY